VPPTVYEEVRSLDSFQPWLDLVPNFPVEVVDEAWKQIPRSWYDSDQDELEKLFEQFLRRRGRAWKSLIQETRKGRTRDPRELPLTGLLRQRERHVGAA
jgi:hypothetical protein